MREILFKAKRIDNGEWIEGNLLWITDGMYIVPLNAWLDYAELSHFIAVEPHTICQYTGLTDKNGNKIWENDIVIVNNRYKGKVIWSELWTNYMVIGKGNINISIHNRWDDVYEVIGNIFDNEELLKGGAE